MCGTRKVRLSRLELLKLGKSTRPLGQLTGVWQSTSQLCSEHRSSFSQLESRLKGYQSIGDGHQSTGLECVALGKSN